MNFLVKTIAFLYFFIPFQFALNPADGFDVAVVRVLIILIVLGYFAYCLWRKKIIIPHGFIVGFFTAFIMWSFSSLFISPVPLWTARKLIFLISFAPLIFILNDIFHNTPSGLSKTLQSAVTGAFVISIIGILQFVLQFVLSLNTLLNIWLSITPVFLGNAVSHSVIMYNSWLVHVGNIDLMRAIAFFPDPHIFSFYLGLIIPLSIFLFTKTKNVHWLIATVFIIFADLLTFSRGAYFGLFIGFVTLMFLIWPQINIKIRHFSILFLFSLFILLLAPHNPITQRFISSFNNSDTSNTHRIELWQTTLSHIKQKPLIGTGLGAYPAVANPRANYRTPFYAHNLFLDIMVELGIVGLLLFCAMIVSIIIVLYKHRKNFLALFTLISLIIFLSHSIFDTAIFSVHVFPIFILIIMIASYYETHTQKS